MELIQRIVNDINRYTSDTRYSDCDIEYCIPVNTDMWFFGKNIANKLNAIEECICNDYILLKRNNIYIKITWDDFPDDEYLVIYIEMS